MNLIKRDPGLATTQIYEERFFQKIMTSGNNVLFTEIVNTYSSKLFSIAFYITKSKPVSEDIVQEAFLKLWQKKADIITGNIGGWLYRVVSNCAYKHLKRTSREMQMIRLMQADKQEIYTEVEERLMNKEAATFFDNACRKLPARQQEVYHLSQQKGLSRDEIAAHLNISPNTVKVHLLRAFQFIREHIASVCLMLIFFVINTFFLKTGNTNSRSKDLYKVTYTTDKNLSRETVDLLLYSRSMSIEKNQSK
jgi:RNA polymerase sigma-70 factor (family 1)